MICLYLSSLCEDRLVDLGIAYEEATGQLFNPAGFVEHMIMNLDVDNIIELITDDGVVL